MSMEIEITSKQVGFEVDTARGIWYVPGDLLSAHQMPHPEIQDLQPYVEPDIVEGGCTIKRVYGYFGRWQMPGYLDCTEWMFETSKKRLLRELKDL